VSTNTISSSTSDQTLEIVDIADWPGPWPQTDPISEHYFRACADGSLLVEQCPVCAHIQHFPRGICVRCGASPRWLASPGRGTIYSYTVVRQMGVAPFSAHVPYVVALIELDEGPRLIGNIVDCDVDSVRIGATVGAIIHRMSPQIGIPQWRLS
jgi:uncharacterized OB-fold protein